MAQRTSRATLASAPCDGLRGMLSRLQAEEHEPVPARAGHALGHAAQGSEPPPLMLKPIRQYLHLDGLAPELALQHHSRQRQPLVANGIEERSEERRVGKECRS